MKRVVIGFFCLLPGVLRAQDSDSIRNRMAFVSRNFESLLFVRRFESVQTPCVCIDPANNGIATVPRDTINSNYRIMLHADSSKIDSGVACLSRYYAQYVRFTPIAYVDSALTITGTLEFSYSYSASSIIQYLGMTRSSPLASDSFFNKLITSKGSFRLYPENDKYRISITFSGTPFNKRDTIYGYVEMVEGVFEKKKAINIFFDEMNSHGGDNNNQIFLKFTSTAFTDEGMFYMVMLYNVLKFEQSEEVHKKAEALWTKSFFSNSTCSSCAFIYNMAEGMVHHNVHVLPNTEPSPAH